MSHPSQGRIPVSPLPVPGNAGIRLRYPIDRATWVWHPEAPDGTTDHFLEFALDLDLSEAVVWDFEMSADQRYCLSCDGEELGRGPDRSELDGWAFHRYRVSLSPGTHRLRVLAWWLLPEHRPFAQVSARPAFGLVGCGPAEAALSTGLAPWRVRSLPGWSCLAKPRGLHYHVIGSGFQLDGHRPLGNWVTPCTVAQGRDMLTGTLATPWRCAPSPLPEQQRCIVGGGRIRAVQSDHDHLIRAETDPGPYEGLAAGSPVTVPPHQTLQILWDFEDYLCGYTRLQVEGGCDAEVRAEWAESLYEGSEPDARRPKGDRAACAGKTWLGFGDCFRHAGGAALFETPWWRSGRWLLLRVRTQDEALRILDARPRRSTYPYVRRWAFSCDRDLGPVLDLCERGLTNCVHETFVDCPYYEQMQYIGDTRVQALTWLVATGDPRPVRRALELFDRSRWMNGFCAERCPSADPQASATYSLVQPPLLRDYAWWTDDPETVRALLPGTRCALEYALACLDEMDLPSRLPGWLFVDWVKQPDWPYGVPGGDSPTVAAPIALHLPVALDAAAKLEQAYGDPFLAQRWQAEANRVLTAILANYRQADLGLISDDPGGTRWSEHAQALALDCSGLPLEQRKPLLDALESPGPHLARASVYFSHHVHEALLRDGRVDAFLARLAFWEQLRAQGFVTTVEAPEPSRSDCHGWGAHPLYHCLSAVAGIRPGAPGFARVVVTPRLGPLRQVSARMPHPRGELRLDLRRDGNRVQGTLETPVPGLVRWQGREQSVHPGRNSVDLYGPDQAK